MDAAILVFGLGVGAAVAALVCWLLLRRRGTPWSSAETVLQRVREMAQAGSQLDAIRLYRQLTGKGLSEATDVVDALAQAPREPAPDSQEIPPNTTVEKLVRQHRIPEAIRAYQDQTGADPAAAREVVERLRNGVN